MQTKQMTDVSGDVVASAVICANQLEIARSRIQAAKEVARRQKCVQLMMMMTKQKKMMNQAFLWSSAPADVVVIAVAVAVLLTMTPAQQRQRLSAEISQFATVLIDLVTKDDLEMVAQVMVIERAKVKVNR